MKRNTRKGSHKDAPKKDAPKTANLQDTLRKIDSSPSHTEGPTKHRQIPVDLIEEESMESFPASDPPAHFRDHPNRPEPRRPGQSVE